MTKKKKVIIVVSILLVIFVAWVIWGNKALQVNTYVVSSSKVPEGFDDYRIAHVSDLHNDEFGKENKRLIKLIKNSNPDIIVITGDLIDSKNTKIEVALRFAEQAMQIAPCYYVTGNHEARIDEYKKLKDGLIELGVVVLENKKVMVEFSGDYIALLGTEDPSFKAGNNETVMTKALQEIAEDEKYTVLLSHRPELFNTYSDYCIDLVLAGHAHGGQFRLPFVGGLVAPDQGYFPQYDSGEYIDRNTTMIVSRGIGNSIVPIRFNNRPEVVLVVLKTED
ncbi:MAG: metallophosphoesterase [Clostridia bacterium]|nr:metallophosphoesterase [Clostridia bacterium]